MRKILSGLKWVILGIIALAIVIPVGLGIVKKFAGASTTSPKVSEAPYEIMTTSRIYYGKLFSIQDGTPALKGYWTIDGKNYNYHSGVITFPESMYGKFGYQVVLIQRIAQAGNQ